MLYVEPRAHEDGPPVLVEQGERDRGRDLETSLTVETQVANGGRALERTGELDLLRARLARPADSALPSTAVAETALTKRRFIAVLVGPFSFGQRYSKDVGRKS